MQKEKVGNLIDGVYAIALTILVLDLPKPDSTVKMIEIFPQIREVLINYIFSFLLLFNFWINQRNINDLPNYHSQTTLWLNGLALMFVCLIPYSTSLLHIHGNNAYIDMAYIINSLIVDITIYLVLLSHKGDRYDEERDSSMVERLIRSRKYSTVCFTIAVITAMLLPVPKKNILFVVPLFLVFENKIVAIGRNVFNSIRKIKIGFR